MKKIISIIALAIAIVSLSSCDQMKTTKGLVGTKWETTTVKEGKTITLGLLFISDTHVSYSVKEPSAPDEAALLKYIYEDPNITIIAPSDDPDMGNMVGTVKGDEIKVSTSTEHYTFKKKK